MEPNYHVIETLVQKARQQRSQVLGELIAAGWNKCRKLLSSDHAGVHQTAVVWRTLPP